MIKKLYILLLLIVFSIGAHSQTLTRLNLPYGGSFHDSAWLIVPQDTSVKRPIWVHLHGQGGSVSGCSCHLDGLAASASDGGAVYWYEQGVFTDKYLNPRTGDTDQFWVLEPQDGGNWSATSGQVNQFIQYLQKIHPASMDITRIYVEGLSAGGEGAATYIGRYDATAGVNAPFTPVYPAAAAVPMSMAVSVANAQPDTMGFYLASVWGFGDTTGADIYGTFTKQIIDTIYKVNPSHYTSDSTYSRLHAYTGGHCCWEDFTDPRYTENIKIADSVGSLKHSMNIYEWASQFYYDSTSKQTKVINNSTPSCDLTINSILLNSSSCSVCGNGSIIIGATSTAGGIEYSLDNSSWQSNDTIKNLLPGYQNIYVKDANGCTVDSLKNWVSIFNVKDTIIGNPSSIAYRAFYFKGADSLLIKGKDTLFIRPDTWQDVRFYDLIGTSGKVITVKPLSSAVTFSVIDTTNFQDGIYCYTCQFVHVDGSMENTTYGFVVRGGYSGTSVIRRGQFNMTDSSHDVEMNNIYLDSTEYGFTAKWDVTCDSVSWNDNDTSYPYNNIKIHDSYIGNTEYEGMYVGYTHNYRDTLYDVLGKPVGIGGELYCSGDTSRHAARRLANVHIWDIKTWRTGYDGIQVNGVQGGQDIAAGWLEVDHDSIYYAGQNNTPGSGQVEGFSLGQSGKINVHDNYIYGGNGEGVYIGGMFDSLIVKNNMIDSMYYDGIYLVPGNPAQSVPLDPDSCHFFIENNTIQNTQYGINIYNGYLNVGFPNYITDNTISDISVDTLNTHGVSATEWYGQYGGLPVPAGNPYPVWLGNKIILSKYFKQN